MSGYFSVNAQFEISYLKGSSILALDGSQYIYEVDMNGHYYDFVVNITTTGNNNERKFDYILKTSDPKKGSVVMTEEALENAVNQMNYFSGGDSKLTDMTSVWISKKVFNELLNEGKSEISPNGGETMITLITDSVGYDFSAYNKISNTTMDDIKYILATDPNTGFRYTIHASEGNPFILYMDIGFKVYLIAIDKWKEFSFE